jgi:hypothetical protein
MASSPPCLVQQPAYYDNLFLTFLFVIPEGNLLPFLSFSAAQHQELDPQGGVAPGHQGQRPVHTSPGTTPWWTTIVKERRSEKALSF